MLFRKLTLLVLVAASLAVAPVMADVIDDDGGPTEGSRRPVPAAPAPAPAPAAAEPTWRFVVPAYMALPLIEGISTIQGVDSNVSVDGSDTWGNFDGRGAGGGIEAYHKSGFGMFVRVDWIGFDSTRNQIRNIPTLVQTKTNADQVKLDFGISYKLLDVELGEMPFAFEPILGGRWGWLDMKVTPTAPGTGVPLVGRTKQDEDWWTMFVGARATLGATDKLNFYLDGTAGGFSIGDAPRLTWEAGLTAGYAVTELLELRLGYYGYAIDYSQGSRVSGLGDAFGLDMVSHGPRFGLALHF